MYLIMVAYALVMAIITPLALYALYLGWAELVLRHNLALV